jgi:hypothetical protein
MCAGGLETHNSGRRSFPRSFSEDEARIKQNQKKAAENFLSLVTSGMGIYDHQSAQTQAQIKHNGKREISSSRSTL